MAGTIAGREEPEGTGELSPGPPDSRALPLPPRRPQAAFGARKLALAGSVLLVVAVLATLAVRLAEGQGSVTFIRTTGVPADVSTSLATLMSLSPVPVRPAPNFTLVDQRGRTASLASFGGRTVVLEFMDPHCTDICPLVSQEFVDAYHDLGKAASSVVFAAVNVNQYHNGVADVAAFSTAHALTTIPSWHFFTGPVGKLQAVWRAYGVYVQARGRNADVVHSSLVYFIGPNGTERYLASPVDDHTAAGTAYLPAGQLTAWGRGIALVARSVGA